MVRKYGKKAQESVHEEMKEVQKGELTSGRSGKKVTNPRVLTLEWVLMIFYG
jgi:hypothetical protein